MSSTTSIETAAAREANVAWSGKGIWSLYEFVIPINFLHSLRTTFARVGAAPRGNVMDIGCGSGLSLRENLAWIKAGGRVTAVDPDAAALARTTARAELLGVASQVSTVQLRAQDVAAQGGLYDGAFAHFSLYTIPSESERRAAVRAALQVIKPGARFACAVPAEGYNRKALVEHARQLEAERTDVGAWTRFQRRFVNYSVLKQANRVLDKQLDSDVMHRYTRRELLEHFQAAGFVDIAVEHIDGFNAYQAVGRRPERHEA